MLIDTYALFADELAYDGTPEELDLETIAPGPGKPIKCFFTTLVELEDIETVNVLTADASVADEALISFPPPAPGTTLEFYLPSSTKRFVTLTLTEVSEGTPAGSFTSGVVLDVQTST